MATATTGRKITAQDIKALLERSDRAVERAVVLIYHRQTADERAGEVTVHSNGVGFNAFDAEILSSFAKQIELNRWNMPEGRILSAKQMVIARRKMMRYTRQLIEEAEAKAAREERERAMVAVPEPVPVMSAGELSEAAVSGEVKRMTPELLGRIHQNVG